MALLPRCRRRALRCRYDVASTRRYSACHAVATAAIAAMLIFRCRFRYADAYIRYYACC